MSCPILHNRALGAGEAVPERYIDPTKYSMISEVPVDQRKAELVSLIDQFTATDGIHTTAVPRVTLIRAARPTEPLHVIQGSAICIVAQGRKQVMLGPRVYTYDSSTFIVSSVDVPVVGQVIEASQDKPYLCFVLSLDPAMLSALMLEAGVAGPTGAPSPAFALSDVTPELLDATNRLLWLLASPRDIPVLAPLAEREILYRLLRDEANPKLREIALADSKLTQVNRAISWIKQNYREPLRIEDVAQEARMSPSALHAHFKAITTMSPLQYQKQLRLQEARRLILAGAFDAAAAGHRVGYSSASQFSREYRRLFGAPPARDIARLKAMPPDSFVTV